MAIICLVVRLYHSDYIHYYCSLGFELFQLQFSLPTQNRQKLQNINAHMAMTIDRDRLTSIFE